MEGPNLKGMLITIVVILGLFFLVSKMPKIQISDYEKCLMHSRDNCAIVKCLDSVDKKECYKIFGGKN